MIEILSGNVHDYDQNTIDTVDIEKLERVVCGAVDYKDALRELVQKLNDEEIDDVNNYFTIREVN